MKEKRQIEVLLGTVNSINVEIDSIISKLKQIPIHGYDSHRVTTSQHSLVVYGYRQETDEEYAERQQDHEDYLNNQKAKEIKLYLQLKEKYGDI